MKQVFIIRFESTDQGTLGILIAPDGFRCYTLEPPWRDNQRGISCIPTGGYVCMVRQSPRFGQTYHVTGVKGRSYILKHPGNYAGDVSKGYKTNSNGCILLGAKAGYINGQRAILSSRPTVRAFMDSMDAEDYQLTIMEVM